jgi:flavin reductase (DIM6/NTAB) family NADH-FMN oxidoreductase RutF
MECTLREIVRINHDSPGGGSLVIGEIVLFHVADELYHDGRIDIEKLNPLGRLAGDDYTRLGDIVSHTRKTAPKP